MLMASHIFKAINIIRLQRALNSILKNTKPPECIILSISFENEELNQAFTAIELDSKIKVYIQPKRCLQFAHYEFIHKQGLIHDEDIIGFSDDDDITRDNKIETILPYFEADKDLEIVRHDSRLYVSWGENVSNEGAPCVCEYFCLCMKGKVFSGWFNDTEKYTQDTFENILNRHGFTTDLLFNCSVEPKHKHIKIPNILVNKITYP